MAFFGLVFGMITGAIAAFLVSFVFDLPIWVGLFTYSTFGAASMIAAISIVYLRRGDDGSLGSRLYDEEAYLDEEWIIAASGDGSDSEKNKVA